MRALFFWKWLKKGEKVVPTGRIGSGYVPTLLCCSDIVGRQTEHFVTEAFREQRSPIMCTSSLLYYYCEFEKNTDTNEVAWVRIDTLHLVHMGLAVLIGVEWGRQVPASGGVRLS